MEKRLMAITMVWSKINGYYNQWMQENNIKGFQGQILLALLVDNDMTQKEISEKFQMPKQSVNNVIRDLEKKEFVRLEQSTDDNRKKIVTLTTKGREYAENAIAPFSNLDKKVFKRMGKEAFQTLMDGLNAYENALKEEIRGEK